MPDLDRFLGTGPPRDKPRPSNRAIARIVLAIMGTMALVALVFAWETRESRRERDRPKTAQEEGLARIISTAPAKQPALTYLPEKVSLIAGLHVAELLDEPECKNILSEMRYGRFASQVENLQHWTGLALEDIDHVVVGVRFEELVALPHVTVVVRVRRPLDLERIRAHVKAGRPLESKKRVLYRYPLGGSGLEGVFSQVDERTLIYGLAREDLEACPTTPITELEQLPPSLRSAMGELSEGTQAWAVGDAGDWQKSLSWLPVPELHEALARIRDFTTSLHVDREAVWSLRVQCTNERAAVEFARFLDEYLSPDPAGSSWRSLIGSDLKQAVEGKTVSVLATIRNQERAGQ
jgi:hypothetical protein